MVSGNGGQHSLTIAILIPAYNEARTIQGAVWSCYRAGAAPADVYVCDDGSTDGTAAIADALNAHVLSVPNGGKASVIRRGLVHFDLCVRYEWISILDADCLMADDYLVELRTAIQRHPTAALIGGHELGQRGRCFNWLVAWRAVEYAIYGGVFREAQHAMKCIVVIPGLCSTFRSSIFATLDFTNRTLVEDMDWTMQLHRHGEEIIYAPRATVYSQNPRTLRDYLGQISRWYRGTWQVIHLHQLGRHRRRIDAEMILCLGELYVFTAFLALLPIWLYWIPGYIGRGFLVDQAILLTYTILVAVRERRWDVLIAFPLFSIPRVLNIGMFTWAYLAERRQPETRWYSVARE